jgi:hypothetical protein
VPIACEIQCSKITYNGGDGCRRRLSVSEFAEEASRPEFISVVCNYCVPRTQRTRYSTSSEKSSDLPTAAAGGKLIKRLLGYPSSATAMVSKAFSTLSY